MVTLIQVSDSRSVKEWLSFIDVAIFPQIEIDYLYGVLYGFLTKVVHQLTNLRMNDVYNNRYLSSKLSVFTEALSYLCIRLRKENLNDIFNLAVQIYTMEPFREGFSSNRCPDRLFEMIFYCLPESEIINKLDTLLALPVAGENGFEVRNSDDLVEPFQYIKWSYTKKIDNKVDTSQWSEIIQRLIYIVKNGTPEARKRASLRLGKLNDIEILTAEQQNLFALALWKNYDPDNSSNNLPEDTAYNVWGFLFLPEPEPGIAKDILSQYIINLFTILDDNSSINNVSTYCTELLNSTSPLFNNDNYYSKYINWSSENVEFFLNKISNWWTKNKIKISDLYKDPDPFLYYNLLELIQVIRACVSIVILPRIKESNDDHKQLAKQLINELENMDISILFVLPMTLFIESADVINDVGKKLRFGLSSLDPEATENAILGLQYWLICSQQEQIPEPPPKLLNDLVNKVFHRKLPRLNFAIHILADILSKFPSILNEHQLETLLFGLELILQDIKLPDDWVEWKLFNKDINSAIEIEDRPEYMRLTAYLALQLYEIYEKRDTELPQILISWKDASLNSVFPEVRKVWEGYS